MKTSVIIPSHNAGRWIAESLRSVAKQIHSAHEIIVVNDASDDDSAEQVRASGVSVRMIDVNVRSAAAARNAGIDIATGDWVAFLDADNRWLTHHLSQAVELLSGTGDAVCMSYPQASCPLNKPTSGLNGHDFLRMRLQWSYGFPTTGLIVRRDVLDEVGRFDVTQHRRHDLELFARLVAQHSWSFHPRASWFSRPPRPGDISHDRAKCKYFAVLAFVKNRKRFPDGLIDAVIRRETRQAVLEAMRTGTDEDRARATQLAESRLAWLERLVLGVRGACPRLARSVSGMFA